MLYNSCSGDICMFYPKYDNDNHDNVHNNNNNNTAIDSNTWISDVENAKKKLKRSIKKKEDELDGLRKKLKVLEDLTC
ncbi:hypothetical protein INT45_011224 [Circinella minor]|uniref:Uncharacterized protein n=1 Tax=Circinella minor TaxID=1195481 RepID=A0A8H7S709_9FUNG|nr:hypothetical protein INT45_011224 [Circinella minor]